jgi:hypothetical protein
LSDDAEHLFQAACKCVVGNGKRIKADGWLDGKKALSNCSFLTEIYPRSSGYENNSCRDTAW